MTMTQGLHTAAELQEIPFADCFIHPDARAAAMSVLESGWVTTGRQNGAFESEFAAAVQARHAVAVSSCTAGIQLALRSLRLRTGARVLTSTNTFCGAVHAIVQAGLRPVLVDVDPETGMPTWETTRRAVDASGGASAMVVVHWAGDPADVAALADAARLPAERIVQDAAHALGTYTPDGPVGSQPGATVFSFYATKNLPIGEGGMVTTDDEDRAAWIRTGRLHGMSADAWRRYLPGGSWRYDVATSGLKANMTDLQAAIGRAQLRHFAAWQSRRAELARHYDLELARLRVDPPHRPESSRGQHAWHLYPVRLAPGCDRDAVIGALGRAGIGTSVHFIPLHHMRRYQDAAVHAVDGLPGADAVFQQLVSIPMHQGLTDREIDLVTRAITESRSRSLLQEVQ